MHKFKSFVSVVMMSAALAAPCLSFAGALPTTAEVEAKFAKILRNTKVASVNASPIPGLYEIISGPNVFYFAPEGDGHLIFGQIVNKDGVNLTASIQEKLKAEANKGKEQAAAAILKDLDLSLAVKIGNGKNIVIEFTDPDCPYCRKADKILLGRSADVTRYVFLFPLDQLHPNARAKSVYVHSSKDKAQALHDVFAGKYDRELPVNSNSEAKIAAATKTLESGIRVGVSLGVQGTPMLFVNGIMVNGADEAKIISLLKN